MCSALEQYQSLLEENNIEVVLPSRTSQYLTEAELFDLVDGSIDGIICSDDEVTERILEKAPKLKVISKWGVGLNSIDCVAAEQRGIRVYNTPGAFKDAVADMTMCYILYFARRPQGLDATVRSGRWIKETSVSLRRLTLGVIGIGNIGMELVWRARAFGMTVLGRDIRQIGLDFVSQTGITIVTLDELLSRSDFVSLNCDLNPTSYHLIGEKELRLMKSRAVLINTARGSVVDEDALIRALEGGVIAGAALDVFEKEPLGLDSPLRQFENVLLAPHNSYNTEDAIEHVHKHTIHNLIKGFHETKNAS